MQSGFWLIMPNRGYYNILASLAGEILYKLILLTQGNLISMIYQLITYFYFLIHVMQYYNSLGHNYRKYIGVFLFSIRKLKLKLKLTFHYVRQTPRFGGITFSCFRYLWIRLRRLWICWGIGSTRDKFKHINRYLLLHF